MSLPLVAVVGRPNVGKSTFVNRLADSNDAIVHEMRGVTRDRSYHQALWNGFHFRLVDTGGIEMGSDDSFQSSIREQAFCATEQADLVIFIVDGTVGIQQDDQEVARLLQRSNKPVLLVVNKLDNPSDESALWEFYSLGLPEVFSISSLHGHGTGDLLDEVVKQLKSLPCDTTNTPEEEGINIAIIGRPNAGKSSLANKLVGKERSIVANIAGTTRDAIDTHIVHDGTAYTIVDTAGLRRKSQIDESVEYYGFVRAMRAIDRADVALLVIDSTLGLTDQDQRVARFALDRGCALIVVLNKWDIVGDAQAKEDVRTLIKDRLMFVGYAPVIALSALTGKNLQNIWAHINHAYQNYTGSIPTNKLNVWLEDIRHFGHTISSGKSILRLKYITQTGTCPPVFTLFANRPDLVDDNYERYLENRMREQFDLEGTPVRFKFKKKD